jgi:hypothetical protein
MQPIFNDDDMMLKLNVVYKLRKLLQNERKSFHKSVLFHRVGTGLSEAEFDLCVKMLEVNGCCTVNKGERGGVIVTLNEAFNDVKKEAS